MHVLGELNPGLARKKCICSYLPYDMLLEFFQTFCQNTLTVFLVILLLDKPTNSKNVTSLAKIIIIAAMETPGT